jgi:hypothetical protein
MDIVLTKEAWCENTSTSSKRSEGNSAHNNRPKRQGDTVASKQESSSSAETLDIVITVQASIYSIHRYYAAISRMAWVRCGNTSGSLSMGKQESGPCRRYVLRKSCSALLRMSDPEVESSSRITVSGESKP